MSKTVIQEIIGSVSQITLNRPDSLNAIDHVLASELREEILSAEMNKEVRCVILKGAGAAFMAGGDIRAFSERIGNGVDRYMLDLTHDLHDAIIAIKRMPKPVLASVHGAAAGAGFSIAMACDMIIAAENSTFTLAYSMLGVSPDGSSTYSLPRLVGYHQAMELVLLSDRFGTEKAKEMGLINFVTAPEDLESETMRLAERLGNGPTAAYGKAKSLLNKSLERGISDQLEAEAQGIMESSRTKDFVEGVDAFLNKRRPNFSGE